MIANNLHLCILPFTKFMPLALSPPFVALFVGRRRKADQILAEHQSEGGRAASDRKSKENHFRNGGKTLDTGFSTKTGKTKNARLKNPKASKTEQNRNRISPSLCSTLTICSCSSIIKMLDIDAEKISGTLLLTDCQEIYFGFYVKLLRQEKTSPERHLQSQILKSKDITNILNKSQQLAQFIDH